MNSDPLLSIDQLIERLQGTNRAYWADRRYHGTGPAYLKIGRKIFVRESALEDWLASKERTQTGDVS